MKIYLYKLTSIIFSITITLLLVSCNTSKKTVTTITNDEISNNDTEVNELIYSADKFLISGDYDNTKKAFIEAITLNKDNKNLYLFIKDKYMDLYRLDDAFFFINLAISNNIDVDNMKVISKNISSMFDEIDLSNSTYQDSIYSLPESTDYSINGKQISLPINWTSIADTSSPGDYTYEGFNNEYGRRIKMQLTVLPNTYSKEIGYIRDIYRENDNIYIAMDLVEFYEGYEALNEAIKDNNAFKTENGNYFIHNPDYIRNNSNLITTYKVSSNCTFSLMPYDIDPYTNEGLIQVPTDYETFYYIEKSKRSKISPLRCWIELKNGTVYSIYRHTTP